MARFPKLASLAGAVLVLASLGHGAPASPASPAAGTLGVVVLLHGLGQGRFCMRWIEADLERAGYAVLNPGYASTEASVETLADDLYDRLTRALPSDTPVHFVTHSMGSLVLRSMLARHPAPPIGRIVMLAPPSQGSEVADRLRRRPFLGWLLGPAALQLGTSREGIAARLPAIDAETGVIAGRCSINPFFSPLIPGPDDGAVSVRATQLAGMDDFLVLCSPHTWMLRDQRARAAVVRFLAGGRFDPALPGTGRR